MNKICYWDSETNSQKERDATAEEIAEIEARKAAANDLTTIRKPIIEAIKTERDRRKFNGVKVSNKWIHTDVYSRTQWMAMVMMGASIPSIPWTTMDLTTINTSQALANQVFQAVAVLDATLFSQANNLIAQIIASNDPSSIDIMTGWLETFEG